MSSHGFSPKDNGVLTSRSAYTGTRSFFWYRFRTKQSNRATGCSLLKKALPYSPFIPPMTITARGSEAPALQHLLVSIPGRARERLGCTTTPSPTHSQGVAPRLFPVAKTIGALKPLTPTSKSFLVVVLRCVTDSTPCAFAARPAPRPKLEVSVSAPVGAVGSPR